VMARTAIRMMTIASTPKTFHHTEMPLKKVRRWLEKTFTTSPRMRIRTNSTITTCALYFTLVDAEVEDEVHVEQAEQVLDELRADVVHGCRDATSPIRLNQPVNQPQPAPPSFDAQ